jgi:hypothetical protein
LLAPAGPPALRERCEELLQSPAARVHGERGLSSSLASTEQEQRVVSEVIGVVAASLRDPAREPLPRLSYELSAMLIRISARPRHTGRVH